VYYCVLRCTNVLTMSNVDERRQPLLFSSCYNGFIAENSQAVSTRIVTEQTTGWPQNRTEPHEPNSMNRTGTNRNRQEPNRGHHETIFAKRV
jgi:hypothetical protein